MASNRKLYVVPQRRAHGLETPHGIAYEVGELVDGLTDLPCRWSAPRPLALWVRSFIQNFLDPTKTSIPVAVQVSADSQAGETADCQALWPVWEIREADSALAAPPAGQIRLRISVIYAVSQLAEPAKFSHVLTVKGPVPESVR